MLQRILRNSSESSRVDSDVKLHYRNVTVTCNVM
jgi:hypothetical protein